MFTAHVSRFTRDFSPKTLNALAKKEVFIYSTQAVPDYPGDVYFSGKAYKLCHKGKSFLRSHSQILVMASSSWTPDQD